MVEGKDDVIGIEGLAILKLHALSQLELECRRVDPLPRDREIALVLAGHCIAVEQPIPDGIAEENPFAGGVVIGVDVLQLPRKGDVERIIRLSGKGCGRHQACGQKKCCKCDGSLHVGPLQLICSIFMQLYLCRHCRRLFNVVHNYLCVDAIFEIDAFATQFW